MQLLVVNYCCKALHFRCLRESWIYLWIKKKLLKRKLLQYRRRKVISWIVIKKVISITSKKNINLRSPTLYKSEMMLRRTVRRVKIHYSLILKIFLDTDDENITQNKYITPLTSQDVWQRLQQIVLFCSGNYNY